MKARTYATGGLLLRSEVRLSPLAEVEHEAVDVELLVDPGEPPEAVGAVVDRRAPGEELPYLRVLRTAGGYRLDHLDGLTLEVLEAGRKVVVRWLDPDLPHADLEHILLDQLLPLIFAQLGRLSFHGSSVSLDGRALCFLADSGTGKSTLAAALATHAGARFLADDEVVLEETAGGFRAHPSYPSVRLWNESAGALFEAAARPHGKHRFTFDGPREATRLGALILLEKGAPDQRDAVQIQPLGPRDGLVGVATHLDRLDPTDRDALRRELEALSRLVERVPVARVRLARTFDRLPEGARAIRTWARTAERA